MYLSYTEYVMMGGGLDATAFEALERKARYLIGSQACGLTGERISRLTAIPQAVKDCTFALIEYHEERPQSNVQSESQSQGGVSESVSYISKSAEDIEHECEKLINEYLYGGGQGYLLYRGCSI